MNALKNIRIATGNKRIELQNEGFARVQINEVLTEHRNQLIKQLLSDLPTYIYYTFGVSLTKDKQEKVLTSLLALRDSEIDMNQYSVIVNEILTNVYTYVKSELFYREINEVIRQIINPSQLAIVK